MQRADGGKLYGTCLVFACEFSLPLFRTHSACSHMLARTSVHLHSPTFACSVVPPGPEDTSGLEGVIEEEEGEEARRSNTLVAVCVLSALPLMQLARSALSALATRTPHSREPDERCLHPLVSMAPESIGLAPLLSLQQPHCPAVCAPLWTLFQYLHPARVCLLLAGLLAEKRILLICSNIAVHPHTLSLS
jgi:hypothetical protein